MASPHLTAVIRADSQRLATPGGESCPDSECLQVRRISGEPSVPYHLVVPATNSNNTPPPSSQFLEQLGNCAAPEKPD
ncbi:unnamed protein product [Toxocara canis]|uniref:Uncharacterized protein n=1 Tax=Toxocara canis TaxID=6265 RepID=A0A183TY23_TOXCA|nr:unnamed protein product [Toxocara canis]